MPDTAGIQQKRISARDAARRIGQQWMGFLSVGLWLSLLFACAGRMDWIRGWVCVGIYVVSMVTTGIIVHHANRNLLGKRAQWLRKDTKGFDKVILSILFALTLIQPVAAGLDVAQFHWSSIAFWTILPSTGIFLLGVVIVTWTLSVNPFAEQSVRIQTERGHRVIRSGPYAFVRHPMYIGSILMYPAIGWMFGSFAAFVVGILIAVLVIVRTAFEDRILRRELPGYAEYSLVTRYRLLPGVW